MPNYISNVIIADEVNMSKIKDIILNSDGNVDFNKLIPMPKDLDIGCVYFYTSDAMKVLYNDMKKVMDNIYSKDITQQDFLDKTLSFLNSFDTQYLIKYLSCQHEYTDKAIKNRIQKYFNVTRYGFEDWYYWRIANWDTKWNSCNTEIGKNIMFSTAWSPPIKVMDKLSNMGVSFVLTYADEGIEENSGIIHFNCGIQEEIEYKEFPKDIAFLVYLILYNSNKNFDSNSLLEFYKEEHEEFVNIKFTIEDADRAIKFYNSRVFE